MKSGSVQMKKGTVYSVSFFPIVSLVPTQWFNSVEWTSSGGPTGNRTPTSVSTSAVVPPSRRSGRSGGPEESLTLSRTLGALSLSLLTEKKVFREAKSV